MRFRLNKNSSTYHIATDDGILCQKGNVLTATDAKGTPIWNESLVDHISPPALFCGLCKVKDRRRQKKKKQYVFVLAQIAFTFGEMIAILKHTDDEEAAVGKAVRELATTLGFDDGE